MEKSVCPDCGKMLSRAGELTDVEVEDMTYATCKERNGRQALAVLRQNAEFLDGEKLIAYVKAACDEIAEGEFLEICALKRIGGRLNVSPESLYVIEGEAYVHAE